jgi:hypothetical protein
MAIEINPYTSDPHFPSFEAWGGAHVRFQGRTSMSYRQVLYRESPGKAT